MIMILRLLALAISLSLLNPASLVAQTVNLKPGDSAPDFKDLPGLDEKKYALADFKDKDVLVIAFTCNSCPYASDYELRLVALAKEYCGAGKQVALVAVNVNKVAEDLPPKMKERAEKQGFNFPYLFDETQEIARNYGALYTPEFFVFDKTRKLVYHGAFDDNSQADKVKKQYVRDALIATLAGEKPLTAETPPVGCAVRYERKKRTKN
jgi:peroxiredoxin